MQDDEDFASLDGVVSAEMDSKAEQLAEELLESLRAGGLATEPGEQMVCNTGFIIILALFVCVERKRKGFL